MLGNETRLRVLRVLARADEPRSFTDLFETAGGGDSGQFSYHLNKLVGHFVAKGTSGYALREPGRRVVDAVYAGTVTGGPDVVPASAGFPCVVCGADVTVEYSDGKVAYRCTACEGVGDPADPGLLVARPFPAAGVAGRSPPDLMRAAATWWYLDALAVSSDVCPQCSAKPDVRLRPCLDHERSSGDEVCVTCGYPFALRFEAVCPNCTFEIDSVAALSILAHPELLAFVGDHGLNVTSYGLDWAWAFEEEILSTEPLRARLTIAIDGDTRSFTLDESTAVVEVE